MTFRARRRRLGEGARPRRLRSRSLDPCSRGEPGFGLGVVSLRVTHQPLFQEGERDVLFVRGNGEAICPLVNCEAGRVRLIGGEAQVPLDLALEIGNGGIRPVSEAEFLQRVEDVADRGAAREVVASQPVRGGFAPPVFAAVNPPPEPEVREAMERVAAEAREQLGEAWK